METEQPEFQKAILDSFKQKSSPFGAARTPPSDRLGIKRTTSDAAFGRVEALRRAGLSPVVSKLKHHPMSDIRTRRASSLKSPLTKSLSSRCRDDHGNSDDDESKSSADLELRQMIQELVILPASPGVGFDDIAGLDCAKHLLTETVTLPLLLPNYFKGIRSPWKGVLLFGPPGTGKTLLAKAIASNQSVTFFNCSSSTLTSKYRGESEKLIKALFKVARERAPSVIFFDEADALVSKRGANDEHEASRRFKSELLQQMDGVVSTEGSPGKHVMVLASSNCPWDIDDAILRRFEKRIYIPLPNRTYIKAALELHLKGIKHKLDFDILATCMEGYSGADIRTVCKDASMMFMRTWIADKSPEEILQNKDISSLDSVVTMEDFRKALDNFNPSSRRIENYEQWAKEYSSC
eukprot:g4399.t1